MSAIQVATATNAIATLCPIPDTDQVGIPPKPIAVSLEGISIQQAKTAPLVMTAGDDFDGLPESMRAARRWLVWRSEENPDPTKKPRKVPYYSNGSKRHGELDTPAERALLASLDEALRALQTGRYTGLGFALGPDGTDNVWQGIDLDDLPNRSHLGDIADDLPGYTEVSPSGRGKHAIGYGKPFVSLGSNSTGIEAYARGRFFTVTGAGAGIHPPTCLADFVEQCLKPIHGSRPIAAPSGEAVTQYERASPQTIKDLRSALLSMRADDRELWVRMGLALKTLGEQGRGLFMEWSATSSEKFDPTDAAEKWDSFKPTTISYQSVFAEAQRGGWLNPASTVATVPIAAATAAQQRGFPFVHARDLLSKPVPIRWLIEYLIECDSLSTLFGASGTAKSFMALDWACCIATGTEWQGKATNKGAVFYIAGEGHAGIGRRLKAWEVHTGISLQDAPLFISKCPAALMDSGNAMSVANAVDALVAENGMPNLIIIDTLARNLGDGEENSNADIGLFINNIDVLLRMRFGATVLIVHHTGWTEKDRARGASAMRAAMDSEYKLEVTENIRALTCTKAKESEAPEPMTFTLEQIVLDDWVDAEGELMTSAVLVRSGAVRKPPTKPLTGANRIAFEALSHALSADGKPPTEALKEAMGLLAPSRAVSEEVWRKRAYDEGISDGEQEAKKKAFGRSRKFLLDMKKVSTWQEQYWLGGNGPDGVIPWEIQ